MACVMQPALACQSSSTCLNSKLQCTLCRVVASCTPCYCQDALSDATSTDKSEAEKEGIKFFNYKINSPVSDT